MRFPKEAGEEFKSLKWNFCNLAMASHAYTEQQKNIENEYLLFILEVSTTDQYQIVILVAKISEIYKKSL